MKNAYTNTIVPATGGTSGTGKATALGFLISILIKFGILKKDLDYHLVRASMVIIFFFFGYQKWFDYEAQGLIPFISNGLLFLKCTLFSASRGPVGFWGFRNGCSADFCS